MAKIPQTSVGSAQLSNPKLSTASPNILQTQGVGPGAGIEALGGAVEKSADFMYKQMDEARRYAEKAKYEVYKTKTMADIRLSEDNELNPDGSPKTDTNISSFTDKLNKAKEGYKGIFTTKDGQMEADADWDKNSLVLSNDVIKSRYKNIGLVAQANDAVMVDGLIKSFDGSDLAKQKIQNAYSNRLIYDPVVAEKKTKEALSNANWDLFRRIGSTGPADREEALRKAQNGDFGFDGKEMDTALSTLNHYKELDKKRLGEIQDVRNEGVINQMLQGSLSFKDLNTELDIPPENGGIPRKILLSYKKGLETNIGQDLKAITSQKTMDNRPTKQAGDAKQYLTMIDSFIDDDTDKWVAREFLAKAYADGITSPREMAVLNPLKKNLDDIKFNRSNGPIVKAIKFIKDKMGQFNASDSEIALSIKQLLNSSGEGNIEESANVIVSDHLKSKIPSINTLPKGGKLFTDAYGNKALIFPDGTIEEVNDKKKVEPK